MAFLPYLSGGPPFTVEVVTDYHGKFDASIGYSLSIRGLLFVLYEQSNDQYYARQGLNRSLVVVCWFSRQCYFR